MGWIPRTVAWCTKNSKITLTLGLVLAIWGSYCLRNIKVDAIPDLSETQVIVFTEWMGRSPDIIEDQITYPLVASMLSAPRVSDVRGFSMFGMSFVYVIFEDGTDLYWARSRVLEYLSQLSGQLPSGAAPALGPDASGVGWVYQYALVDPSGKMRPEDIRTFQDWYLRYWLASVPGVAEVASVGGFEKQFQVELDPNRLTALGIPLGRVVSAIRASNNDVGGGTLEVSEREYYVRGLGYVKNPQDLENISVGLGADGVPIRIADLGRVSLAPKTRRGVSDLDGRGETVGGVVVMRQGEDVSRVIEAVKRKLDETKAAFPPGLELRVVYDRSLLIRDAVATLRSALVEEILVVCIVILFFLLHLRSTIVAGLTIVLSILVSMIPLYYLGISLNIMSMGGIILAVGDIVDGVIVFLENTHKRLVEENGKRSIREVVADACSELGPEIFSALLIIAVSFLPIFALQAQEGKLFHPLAYTKTFAMIAAALLSITVVPPLIALFVRGRIRRESENPLNRWLHSFYKPVIFWSLRHTRAVVVATLAAVVLTAFVFTRLGSEFMPELWEGDLLYMPVTMPGISITAAADLVTRQGEAIKTIPEVETVFGKSGRFETATDPAPLSMFEYTIRLKPRSEWRPGLSQEGLIAELDEAVAVPGLNRAWTKPIRGRIDMLSTGIRTPIGVKIFGRDLAVIEEIGKELEGILSAVPGTRSAYAERIMGGYYVDFEPDRVAMQRYGINVGDAQAVIEAAVGGMEVSQTVIGRERYGVSVRYPRELRDSVESLSRVLVASPSGAQIPLAQLGSITARTGPSMILNENGSLAGYVYVDLEGRDPGGYVSDAKEAVERSLELPPGYFLLWTGQFEFLERMRNRMKIILPVTLFLIFAFLFFSMGSVGKALLVMASVPLSLIGGFLLMWALGYNISVAIWAGAIALIGVAVETTLIMIAFLDRAWREAGGEERPLSHEEGIQAAVQGAQRGLRPVLMAATTNLLGLVPVMIATGLGADVMKRISTPMFGGLASLTVLTLVVIPVAYLIRRRVLQGRWA
jgi:copper/silver efflux system protein